MVIKHFFKKVFGIKKKEKAVLEDEVVEFEKLDEFLSIKEKEAKEKEEKIILLIKEKDALLGSLDEKLAALKAFDIEKKKEAARVKFLVNDAKNKYIDNVKELQRNILKINEKNLKNTTRILENIFLEFNKKAHLNYQKATFLIGKEMSDVKEVIGGYYKEVSRLLESNKEISNSLEVINHTKETIKLIEKKNSKADTCNNEIKLLNRKIKENKDKDKKTLEDINKIKETKDYKKNLELKEEIKNEEKNIIEMLTHLKSLIDFKVLGNIFHNSKEKMNIIKEHKENFESTFKEDNGKSIMSILSEAKLESEKIIHLTKRIDEAKEDISNKRQLIKKDDSERLSEKISELQIELKKLNDEKDIQQKILKNTESEKEEIMNLIRQELENIKVRIKKS